MPMTSSVEAFLVAFNQLLEKERAADVERTGLLFTNCSRKLLEDKGLALGSLSLAAITVGLGGKRYDFNIIYIESILIIYLISVL